MDDRLDRSRCPMALGSVVVHPRDRGGVEQVCLGLDRLSVPVADQAPTAIIPEIDDIYDLAARVERPEERLRPASAGHRDWHNDYAALLIEINDAIAAVADRKAKGVIIRRIRDALRDRARD